MIPDATDRPAPPELEWFRDAYVCEVGLYAIAFPADPNRQALQLRRADDSLAFASGPEHLLLGDVPYLQVFLTDADHDGHFDGIEYSTWMPKGHYMSATDWNVDGQAEIRTTDSPNETPIHEAWVQGGWKRILMKDGFRLVDQPAMRLRRETDGTFTVINEATQ